MPQEPPGRRVGQESAWGIACGQRGGWGRQWGIRSRAERGQLGDVFPGLACNYGLDDRTITSEAKLRVSGLMLSLPTAHRRAAAGCTSTFSSVS